MMATSWDTYREFDEKLAEVTNNLQDIYNRSDDVVVDSERRALGMALHELAQRAEGLAVVYDKFPSRGSGGADGG